jgi:hypothetical protein
VIKSVKGTHDILPDEMAAWHHIERAAHDLFRRYGYREIRTPVFEETDLFARGIGAETDIVSKEMYTFPDRDGSTLTLRPEATAGIVRAVIEHNLMNTDAALKVYALGPMFRRERPQKGRYRQFHQVDVEAFGIKAPHAVPPTSRRCARPCARTPPGCAPIASAVSRPIPCACWTARCRKTRPSSRRCRASPTISARTAGIISPR